MANFNTSGEHVLAPLYDYSKWNGEYIVMLKRITKYPHITQQRVEAHKRWISNEILKQDEREGYYVKFRENNPLMYKGRFPANILDQIRRSDEVEYIQKNGCLKLF